MRVVFDLQALQTESRFRGIGRFTRGLLSGLKASAGNIEPVFLLNGQLNREVVAASGGLADFADNGVVKIFQSLRNVAGGAPDNALRRRVAQVLRESYIASLRPSAVFVASPFEGQVEDAVFSIGDFVPGIPTTVMFYDSIPYHNPETYLHDRSSRIWYYSRLASVRRADNFTTLSRSSQTELIQDVGCPRERSRITGAGVDREIFFKRPEPPSDSIRSRIEREFVLFVGGFEARKNLTRLLSAYASLSTEVRRGHQLVVATKLDQASANEIRRLSAEAGLESDDVVVVGHVSDLDLARLYSNAKLFVFPSLYEGFGLPILEAISCGAPYIAANSQGLTEIVNTEQALFDPYSVTAIKAKMEEYLKCEQARRRVVENGRDLIERYSWKNVAGQVLKSLEQAAEEASPIPQWCVPERIGDAGYWALVDRIKSLGDIEYNLSVHDICDIAQAIDSMVAQISGDISCA